VFESMSDAVIVVDEQNRIVDLNLAARRLANRAASNAVGQPLTQVFASWPELVERYCNMTQADAEVVLGEDEGLRSFDLRISPLHRRNGHLTVTGRLVILTDITKQKRTERALRDSEERFRHIFEEAPIGMAVVGLDGTLLQVNKAFCEMVGYGERELTARGLSALTHPDDVAKDGLLAAQLLTVGLREMQERVELVGGHLLLASQAGGGTLVVAEVPLLAPDEGRQIS
jgi:PAS domain S-box-containing protein